MSLSTKLRKIHSPPAIHRLVPPLSEWAVRANDNIVHPVEYPTFPRSLMMPKKRTIQRARNAKREGKSPTTQAGEFIKETIDEIRKGTIGARSTKQAIAIGLSKARRAGVDIPPPKKGEVSEKTRKNAERAYRAGQSS